MTVLKWNAKEHVYYPYELPENACLFSNNMGKVINCAQCGHETTVGTSFTSKEVHAQDGWGYMVCEDCYKQEWARDIENRGVVV